MCCCVLFCVCLESPIQRCCQRQVFVFSSSLCFDSGLGILLSITWRFLTHRIFVRVTTQEVTPPAQNTHSFTRCLKKQKKYLFWVQSGNTTLTWRLCSKFFSPTKTLLDLRRLKKKIWKILEMSSRLACDCKRTPRTKADQRMISGPWSSWANETECSSMVS